MSMLMQVGLANAAVAGALALAALAAGRSCRRPALVHCLWLLVLIKLVTPPLFRPQLTLLPAAAREEGALAVGAAKALPAPPRALSYYVLPAVYKPEVSEVARPQGPEI